MGPGVPRPWEESMACGAEQLRLFVGEPSLAPLAPRVPVPLSQQRAGAPEAASGPGGCLWGCRGTTDCLCGQGELSDNPLWMEADLGTW